MANNPISSPKISRSEWVMVLGVTLVMLVLTAVPYLLAYTTVQPGLVFMDTLMNPEDSQTYFAKMLQGYDGNWLYTITFTAEPHEPAFLGGFYFLLGHIARWTGASLALVWHLARAVSVAVLMVVTYGFMAAFVADRRIRSTAYLLAVFSAGLGWLLFILGQPYWLGVFPIDFKMPEAHLFFASLTFPHIILSTAFLLVSFWCVLQAYRVPGTAQSWLYAAAASLVNLCLGILHPLLIYLIVLTGSLYWFALVWRARRILWQEGFVLVAAYALPGLLYFYYGYNLLTNDVLRGWDANRSGTVSPPWPHFVLAFGPFLLLAGIHWAWQQRRGERMTDRWLFCWIWVLAAALLIYAPLNSQRRFIQGVHVPLSILAAAGFVMVALPWLLHTRPLRRLLTNARYTEIKMARFITAVFLLVMALSNLYIWTSVSASAVLQQPDLLFRPADELAAVAWLRAENERSSGETAVVLGEYQTGNLVAARAGNQVVVGHWAETINYDNKLAEAAQFFDEQTGDEWRQALLKKYGIQYVWHGPREQALGAFKPETAVYLRPVYQNETITIYAVTQ